MRLKKEHIVFAFLLMPAAIYDWGESAQPKSNEFIKFKGEISEAAVDKFIKETPPTSNWLLIQSEGGEARAAMRLGRFLVARKMSVSVEGYCLSACANYIFSAGFEKILQPGAILGLHGKALNFDSISADKREGSGSQGLAKNLLDLSREENEYFISLGISPEILKHSFELTRNTSPRTVVSVHCRNEDRQFDASQNAEIDSFIRSAIGSNRFLSVSVTTDALSAKKFYFPSLKSIEQAGFGKIRSYSYPATPDELKRLGENFGLNLIGDF